jgi:hypothetical protein
MTQQHPVADPAVSFNSANCSVNLCFRLTAPLNDVTAASVSARTTATALDFRQGEK